LNDFREIFDRLKEFYNVSSDRKVSEIMGINYNTVKTWSNRGKIPIERVLEKLQNETINLNWLLTGEGEMYPKKGLVVKGNHNISSINNSNLTIGSTHPKNVSDDEDKLLETFRSLPEDLRKVYLLRMEADAIEHRLRRGEV
jgi:hypothetical protein